MVDKNWLDLGLSNRDIGRFAAWAWDVRGLPGPDFRLAIRTEAEVRWPDRDEVWYNSFVKQACLATKQADFLALGVDRPDLGEEN